MSRKYCFSELMMKRPILYLKLWLPEKFFCKLINLCATSKKCLKTLQKTNTFPELVKVLSHFCRNPASDDPIALEAAVLLGRLCVDDDNARAELKRSLESTTSDTHKKAKVRLITVYQSVIWQKHKKFMRSRNKYIK